MFIIELTYKASLSEIDAHMAAHVVFLKKYYASGNFLMSGRKIPRSFLRARPRRLSDYRVPCEPTRGRHPETDRGVL